MPSYIFIGGANGGLSFSVADDADYVQSPVGVTDSEVYVRETLGCGDASITIFRHESLTPAQVLDFGFETQIWTIPFIKPSWNYPRNKRRESICVRGVFFRGGTTQSNRRTSFDKTVKLFLNKA
jgi:hypothetical protein